MADILNKGKLGHAKSIIIVSYQTLIKKRYCNIHNKPVGGKSRLVGLILPAAYILLNIVVHCKWRSIEQDTLASEALRLWIVDCRGIFWA